MKASFLPGILAAWSVCSGCSYHSMELPVDLGAASNMQASPAHVPADGISPVQITVNLKHGNDTPATDLHVRLYSSDPNDVLIQDHQALRANQQLTPDANGLVTARFVSSYPGSKIIICSVLDGNRALVNLSASVMFEQATTYPTFGASTDKALLAAGDPFSLEITALSAPGTVATDYVGTVFISSSDPNAELPASVTFGPGDQGVVRIENVVLHQAGTVTITVTDTTLSSLNGVVTVMLEPGDMAAFALTLPDGTPTAGEPAALTVTAVDAFGNATPSYTGVVTVTAADPDNTNLGPALPPGVMAVLDAGAQGTATVDNVLTLYAVHNAVVLTAEDGSGHTGVLQGIVINPAEANALVAQADVSTLPQGGTVHVTATLLDAFGNVATNSNVGLQVTSSDPQAGLPNTFVPAPGAGGTHAFAVVLQTVSSGAYITVTPTAGTPAAARVQVAVTATGPYFVGTWNSPGSQPAGTPLSLTIAALAQDGSPLASYAGTVSLASTDPNAVLPGPVTIAGGDQGTATVQNIVLTRAGTRYVIMKDAGRMSGASGGIVVTAGPASTYAATLPDSIVAGVPFNIRLAAQDSYGNTDPNYAGSATITYSDPQGTGPGSYTFGAPDAGATTVAVTLRTAGQQMVTFADTTQGFSDVVTLVVNAGPPGVFAVQTDTSAVVAGQSFGGMVRVYDRFGNPTGGYTGPLLWSSNNANALLPQNDMFLATDAGSHHFTATLYATTPGSVVTVTDARDANITGSSAVVAVAAGAATRLAAALSLGGTPTAGAPFNVTLRATDSFGNTNPNVTDTVALVCNANNAVFPANATLSAGSAVVSMTLQTTPGAGLSVTDVSQPALTAATLQIPLQAAPAAAIALTQVISPVMAGGNAVFSVTATDIYNNVATGYSPQLSFTSNDPLFTPVSWPFAATATGVINVTTAYGLQLRTAGTTRVGVTDGNGLQAGATIVVTPAAATKLGLSIPASPVAGTATTVTLSALDPFSNIDPNFVGGVRFSSSDPCATFLSDASFTLASAGRLTLPGQVTFGQAGAQTLLVTDKSQTQITGSTALTVQPGAAKTLGWPDAPGSIMAGVAFSATVQALDAYGNVATGYQGTVHLGASPSGGGNSSLPANRTYTTTAGGDLGRHTFTGISLKRTSSMSLIATDTGNANITGTVTVGVTPSNSVGSVAFAAQPGNTNMCLPFSPPVQVAMFDIYNNLMTQNSNVIALQGVGGTLGGSTAVAAVGGVATFTNAYPKTGTTVTVRAVLQDAPAYTGNSGGVAVGAQGAPVVNVVSTQMAGSCATINANITGTCGQPVDINMTFYGGYMPITIASTSANGLGYVRSDTPLSFTWDTFATYPYMTTNATATIFASAPLDNTRRNYSPMATQTAAVNVSNISSYFSAGTFSTTGSSAVQGMIGADITGEKALDLIFFDSTELWFVTGTGTNGALAHPWVSGSTPLSLAAGDINLDGHADLVGCVQGATARSMVYQLGLGNGVFGATTTVTSLADCYDTLLTDINNDGHVDILTQSILNPAMTWVLGDGAGNFTAAAGQSVALSWAPANGALVADVTGDGNVDVFVGQASPGTMVAFIRNIGTPGHTTLNYAPGGSDFHFAHGDVNRDGADDALIMSSASSYLYTGISATNLGSATPLSIPGNIALLHDMDRDGMLDLIAGVNGAAIVWRGNGTGSFVAQNTIPTAVNTGARALFAGPLHHTPYLGLVTSNGDNSVTVFLTDPPHACAWDLQGVHLQPVGRGISNIGGVASGDFDEDGKLDIVANETLVGGVAWMKGDGYSSFVPDSGGFVPIPVTQRVGTPVVADINYDGHSDIAAPTTNGNYLAILEGDGNGNFSAPAYTDTGVFLASVIGVDLNLDGKTDFVGAGSMTNNLVTLTGPQYGSPTLLPTASNSPVLLAAGDINLDGWPDVAVASQDVHALSVFLNAAGHLTLSQVYTSGTNPVGLALADVNGDNELDVVMADAGTLTLYVRTGAGNGTFSGSVNYSLPCTPTALSMGNFDLVNSADVAVSCGGAWEGMLVIYNNGSGNFSYTSSRTIYIPMSLAPGGSTTADFSNDGRLDLAAASPQGAVITLAINNGQTGSTGSFYGAAPNKLNGTPENVALADINRDGMPDVLATNNSQLGVLLGAGTTTLSAEADFGVNAAPAGLATGQVMHNGVTDVVVGSSATTSISYFRNGTPRDGNAAALSLNGAMSTLPYAPTRVVLADVDNNGTQDALVASDHLQVLQFSAATATLGSPAVTALAGVAHGLEVGDINNDGWVDAAMTITGSNAVVVLLNNRAGAFPAVSSSLTVTGGPRGLALADIDADGKLDAVTHLSTASNGTVAVLMGDGAGNFTAGVNIDLQTTQPNAAPPNNIYVKDVTGDTILDLVVPLTHTFGVLTIPGSVASPWFTGSPTFLSAGSGALDVALGDMNRDGQTDYVVVDQVGNQISILPGN